MSAAIALTDDELYADSLRAGTLRFKAQVEAAQAKARAEQAAHPPRKIGPAMQAAMDAMAQNARQFAGVRIEEMRRLDIEQAPALSGRYGRTPR